MQNAGCVPVTEQASAAFPDWEVDASHLPNHVSEAQENPMRAPGLPPPGCCNVVPRMTKAWDNAAMEQAFAALPGHRNDHSIS